MKKFIYTPTLVAIVALLAACGSVPNSTSLLDQTRSDYRVAQSSPNVANYAPLELKQAGDALNLANAAASDNASLAKIDNLAYLAKQKIALAQEVAKQKSAEADIANAGKERDQVRLDQRTNEANAANIKAERAKQAALLAQNSADQAHRDTELAQREAANAQRLTQESQARAAQLEAQLADLSAQKTARGMVITLGDVLFGTDLDRLTATGMRTVQKLAQVLQENPQRSVLIEGFADSTGAADYNQGLSERRASAVRNSLNDFGVTRDRIDMRGYGETHPVAANDSAAGRQLNRRVEIVLSNDSGRVIAR
ncbi:MAG: flagellar motor protein MotB [Comamonadaceae bacterium CG1_02_60_18]|nr:MAG: flagellar motor protein MotB [Comamonadaceae bacterium CG1_02_60_18]PIQ50697.1 MAG: flagellar motor protein MotB [Comamonadaceae bacterium CG12_big_fil_rev_8_21_14_0_65_59_15]